MRRAARVDANQDAIVSALRAAGASVQPLSAVGQGCPDLLAGFRGTNYLLECKNGAKYPAHRRLTADQKEWIPAWRGAVCVVLSPEEALRAIGVIA